MKFFLLFITYFGRIIAWQTAMKNQIIKQQIIFDLNMSSRSWQNCFKKQNKKRTKKKLVLVFVYYVNNCWFNFVFCFRTFVSNDFSLKRKDQVLRFADRIRLLLAVSIPAVFVNFSLSIVEGGLSVFGLPLSSSK